MDFIISTFIPLVAAGVLVLVWLFFSWNRETTHFIEELQCKLKSRIISHNKEKARAAILATKNNELKSKNQYLQNQVSLSLTREPSFKGTLSFDTIAEQQDEMKKLEMEITSIREILNSDIKGHLAHYIEEVDGLRHRLEEAKEFSERITQTGLEDLNKEDVA